jgi:beta-galactosidase
MDFPHIIYGGDYNPDQWPEEVWPEDARLMREAGVNLVSLGIFSWSQLEPRADEFRFDWLDRLMDLLHDHGVSVNLATPTAAPPAWLVRRSPEVLPVASDGQTLWHGSRRHYCPHSPAYLERADMIAARLAERYASHPALAMWHVDNEYASGVTACYCKNSIEAFRAWLQTRYGSLADLNHAWGTAFWSQRYSAWDEIHPPRRSPAQPNPTQQLDWSRFNSDSWIECFERQKRVLCRLTPNVPVTTNFMGFHKPADYWKFAARTDLVANDSYPDLFEPEWMVRAGMVCDLMRSLGNRRPWILMEQAPTHVNWRRRNATKRPGVMRLGSYQAVARGADGVMFFQWRASKSGAEKHHSGMLPHAGIESRVWREVKALGSELSGLSAIPGSQVQAQAAILLDWENWWALEQDSKPSNDLKLLDLIYRYYSELYQRNITCDFVHPEADLTRYKLLLAPNLYLVREAAAQNIESYVQGGGHLLLSFFSGIVDENEHIRLGGYPAPFRDLLGLRIEEYVPYSETQSNTCSTADGHTFGCSLWSDIIHPNSAQVLATYEQDFFAGGPAVTINRFGTGAAFYVGTQPDSTGMSWLIDQISRAAGITAAAADFPSGVEICRRVNGDRSWLFILNHRPERVTVLLAHGGRELLSGEDVAGAIELGPAGVAIVQVG